VPPATSRALGYELLAATGRYDMAVVISDSMKDIVLTGAAIRCRRLLRGAYALADTGLGSEATILVRTITEYVITIGWMLVDPDYHLARWGIKDIDMRMVIHNEVHAIHPEVEILTEDTRAQLRAERARLVAICGDRRTDFPSVKRRAAVAEDEGHIEGMRGWYALPYRADSQAAVHPMIWAIEMMMESHPGTGGVVIHPDVAPGRAQVDVYRTAAHLLGVLLLVIANENDDQALHDRIVRILDQLPPKREI